MKAELRPLVPFAVTMTALALAGCATDTTSRTDGTSARLTAAGEFERCRDDGGTPERCAPDLEGFSGLTPDCAEDFRRCMEAHDGAPGDCEWMLFWCGDDEAGAGEEPDCVSLVDRCLADGLPPEVCHRHVRACGADDGRWDEPDGWAPGCMDEVAACVESADDPAACEELVTRCPPPPPPPRPGCEEHMDRCLAESPDPARCEELRHLCAPPPPPRPAPGCLDALRACLDAGNPPRLCHHRLSGCLPPPPPPPPPDCVERLDACLAETGDPAACEMILVACAPPPPPPPDCSATFERCLAEDDASPERCAWIHDECGAPCGGVRPPPPPGEGEMPPPPPPGDGEMPPPPPEDV